MRIGIITFHRAYNCGAMLQAWALRTVLERLGHKVYFFTSNELGRMPIASPLHYVILSKGVRQFLVSLKKEIPLILKCKKEGVETGIYYDKFRETYLPEINCRDDDAYKHCDLVIIGSDQVLNPAISGWTPHFVGFGINSDKIKKIVYAGSIGDKMLSGEDLAIIEQSINDCSAISVREPFKNYPIVLDPTLLLDAKEYAAITNPKTPLPSEPYLYVYSITAKDFEINLAREVANRMGLKLIITNPWGRYFRNDISELLPVMAPDMMIDLIRGAECVIAGSFHGTALSLLHHKRFVTIRMQVDKEVSRPQAFLERLGIGERIANPETSIDTIVELLNKDYPGTILDKLTIERQQSIEWLRQAISNCASK